MPHCIAPFVGYQMSTRPVPLGFSALPRESSSGMRISREMGGMGFRSEKPQAKIN